MQTKQNRKKKIETETQTGTPKPAMLATQQTEGDVSMTADLWAQLSPEEKQARLRQLPSTFILLRFTAHGARTRKKQKPLPSTFKVLADNDVVSQDFWRNIPGEPAEVSTTPQRVDTGIPLHGEGKRLNLNGTDQCTCSDLVSFLIDDQGWKLNIDSLHKERVNGGAMLRVTIALHPPTDQVTDVSAQMKDDLINLASQPGGIQLWSNPLEGGETNWTVNHFILREDQKNEVGQNPDALEAVLEDIKPQPITCPACDEVAEDGDENCVMCGASLKPEAPVEVECSGPDCSHKNMKGAEVCGGCHSMLNPDGTMFWYGDSRVPTDVEMLDCVCGYSNRPDAESCAMCGTEFAVEVECPGCTHKNLSGSDTCGGCHSMLKWEGNTCEIEWFGDSRVPEGAEMLDCPQCGYSNHAESKNCGVCEVAFAVEPKKIESNLLRTQHVEAVEKINCPNCRGLMTLGETMCVRCGTHVNPTTGEAVPETPASDDSAEPKQDRVETAQQPHANNNPQPTDAKEAPVAEEQKPRTLKKFAKCPSCGTTVKVGSNQCTKCAVELEWDLDAPTAKVQEPEQKEQTEAKAIEAEETSQAQAEEATEAEAETQAEPEVPVDVEKLKLAFSSVEPVTESSSKNSRRKKRKNDKKSRSSKSRKESKWNDDEMPKPSPKKNKKRKSSEDQEVEAQKAEDHPEEPKALWMPPPKETGQVWAMMDDDEEIEAIQSTRPVHNCHYHSPEFTEGQVVGCACGVTHLVHEEPVECWCGNLVFIEDEKPELYVWEEGTCGPTQQDLIDMNKEKQFPGDRRQMIGFPSPVAVSDSSPFDEETHFGVSVWEFYIPEELKEEDLGVSPENAVIIAANQLEIPTPSHNTCGKKECPLLSVA